MCLGLDLFSLNTQWPLLIEEFDSSENVYFCINYIDVRPSQTITIVFFSYLLILPPFFALDSERFS